MAVELSSQVIVSNTLSGIVYGLMLGALASGLTLIWGVMKVVNLSHGYLVIIGMLTSVIFYKYVLNVSPTVSPALAFVLGALVGIAFYYSSLHLIIGKAETMTLKIEMSSLMSTFGFGILILGIITFAVNRGWILSNEGLSGWTLSIHGKTYLEIAGTHLEYTKLLGAGLGVVLVLATELFLRKTVWGLAIRAVAEDSRAVALTGYDPVKVKLLTTILSTIMALIAGALYAIYLTSGISVGLESQIAPLSFVIVVLGGLGSLIGTLIGGLIIGLTYNITLALTGHSEISLSVAFAILLIILIVRPKGLFGR